MFNIIQAESETHTREAIQLTKEYVDWMIATIPEKFPGMNIADMLEEHSYDDVRKKIPGDNVPPYGRLLIALNEDRAAGMIALGKLSDSICEMRTLFVRPDFRGTGIGRRLAQAVIDEARKIGYSTMRLDTLGFMDSALGLYRSLGFRSIDPYLDVSPELKQYVRFLELDLRR
ncbi:MAG: GNAT family N-acetyltransferase [Anaerolineae bacterium]|nr:GNAT family N-acetyltransferase [Anaerolineae bacterium]